MVATTTPAAVADQRRGPAAASGPSPQATAGVSNGTSAPGGRGPAIGGPMGRRTAPGGRGGVLRAAVLAGGLLCAAALTAGCGGPAAGSPSASGGAAAKGSGSPADAAQTREVTHAADTLAAAGTSRVSTAMRMASGGTWVTVTGTGGFDFGRQRGELVLVLPKDAVGKEEHKPITELLTPGALYMKNRGAGVPAGKWVRVDTTRLPDGNLVSGGATEPPAAAELLRGAQDVVYAGAERMRGVEVRHFRGTTDIARAARTASPAVRGPLGAAAKGFAVTRVPFDVWLDGQGRVRRLTEHFTMSTAGDPAGRAGGGSAGAGQGAGRQVAVVSTTTFAGFGAPVPVTMPSSTDIWTGKIVSAQP